MSALHLPPLGGMEAAMASLDSLSLIGDPRMLSGDTAHLFAQLFSGILNDSPDRPNLFRCEYSGLATGGAIELIAVEVLPGRAFLELVTAIAVEREDVSLQFRHGWPILSIADDCMRMSATPIACNASDEDKAA